MKLKVYDSTTSRRNEKAIPTVRITKQGAFYFNKPALNLMNLEKGETISFANDEDNPKDWFIFRETNGFTLKPKGGSSNEPEKQSLGIQCTVLACQIRESLKISDSKNFSIQLATQPTNENDHNMFALITSKIIS